MKTGIMLFVLTVLYGLQSYAQSTISGKVVNETGDPLEYVTIALYSVSDSILHQGGVTSHDGRFRFNNVKRNEYRMTVSMIGFVQVISDPVLVTADKTYTVPDLVMKEDVVQLKEVTISGTRTFIEQQADKMVVNPEAGITTATDNVLDVLRKSPGIVVDKDDNIMLKNKQVKVMIDGRLTYLSGDQLAALLKNTQATSIDRIEIIENPPARFDAEGTAGIINIRTKKGIMKGYNGSLTIGANQGIKFSDNYGLNLNYRNEKWNVYGNYYGGMYQGWWDVDFFRRFIQSDQSALKQYTESDNRSFNNSLKLGTDYYITPKQVFGFMIQGFLNNFSQDGLSNSEIKDMDENMMQQMNTIKNESGKHKHYTLNLNYKYSIDTLGQELNVDADMGTYWTSNNTGMNTSYIPPVTPLITDINQGSTDRFYSLKVDYVLPFNQKTKLETGFKTSLAIMDGDLDYQEQIDQGVWSDPNGMSNQFIYTENINAIYLSAHHSFTEKTKVQAGLRGEQTRAEGDNRTINKVNQRNYFNLFPSLFLQQQIANDHQLGLSYSYRIGRPPYRILNPFVWMLDPYTYNKGNPFLDAQLTHSAKISYTLKKKYILTVDYSYTKNAWLQVFDQDDEKRITIIGWENLNNYYNTSATLVLPVQITKWCKTNTNITGFYSQYQSPFINGEIDEAKFTFQGNTTFTFTLPKEFILELSGYYMSKSVYGMMNFGARGSIDAGIQRQLFNKKATLKLNVSDIFKTQRSQYTSQYNNVDLKGIQYWDSRRVSIAFTWRFGSSDVQAARQRSTGLDEEAGRAGK